MNPIGAIRQASADVALLSASAALAAAFILYGVGRRLSGSHRS